MHEHMKIPKWIRERCRGIEAVVTAIKPSGHVVKIETLGRRCDGDSSVRKIDRHLCRQLANIISIGLLIGPALKRFDQRTKAKTVAGTEACVTTTS